MTLIPFGSFDKVAGLAVPDAHALIEAAGRDIAVVRRDGDGGDAVLDGQA